VPGGSWLVRARSASSLAALPLRVRWLCVAWASASLADWFVLWAVVWSAGLEGWSGAQTAGIIMAARAPAFVGGIAGGVAIDRYGPRTLMVFDGVARTLVMLGLVVNGLLGGFGYAAAVILVLLAGATAPISYSAVRTFLPRLVPGDRLGAANTLLAIGNALPLVLSAGIVGPALELVGLAWAFLVPAVLMVGVVVIAVWLPTTGSVEPLAADSGASVLDTNLSPHAGRSPLTWRRVPAGTLALLCLSTAYFFTFGPVEPVLPLLVRDRLDAGVTTYGLLWSTMGIGALLGLLVAPALTRMSRPGATMAGVAVLNGLAMLPLATTTGVGVALACCLAIGILWTPYSAVEATALQRLTPARHHGKVFGIQRALVISALPAGAAVGALALDTVGVTSVLLGSGLACIAVALGALAIPALRAQVRNTPVPEDR